ncbi:hypothetical protein BG000_008479 [Podila horticola]|nr:hypothetical protein BG000_008479 [Podila horticola]
MEVSTTFLPQSIATLISTVSLGARVSLRTAAIIVEASLTGDTAAWHKCNAWHQSSITTRRRIDS